MQPLWRQYAQVLHSLALAVLFLTLPRLLVRAQSTNEAVLAGTISDPSGAVIPGAALTLTNIGTNIARSTQTNGQGDYSFRALPPANYKMVVEATGFGTVEQDNIVLTVNQKATLNTTLHPAADSTNITVHAIPVLLDSEDATLGTDVSSKYLVQIPLINRDSFGLTFLAGGVTEASGFGHSEQLSQRNELRFERAAQRDGGHPPGRRSAERAGTGRGRHDATFTTSLRWKRCRSSRWRTTASPRSTATTAARW